MPVVNSDHSNALAFYNPQTGHWLTRDPIGEDEGLNVYGFIANNPLNASDLLGLKIQGCIDKYLDSLGLKSDTDYLKDKDAVYTALRDVQDTDVNNFPKLVVIRMMESTTTFTLVGKDENEHESNLKKHIAARQTIINNALEANFTFGVNAPWDPTWDAKLLKDPQAFFKSMNNPNTTLACNRASVIIFETGNKNNRDGDRNYDHVWIPGDWGYIENDAYTEDGDWNVYNGRNLGLQGENVFNTGDDLFWGLFRPGVHPAQSEAWWWAEIQGWTSISGKHGVPAWRTQIKYPSIGLQQ
jgi:hypothetical protein